MGYLARVEAKGEVGARFTYHLLAPCNPAVELFAMLYKRRRRGARRSTIAFFIKATSATIIIRPRCLIECCRRPQPWTFRRFRIYED